MTSSTSKSAPRLTVTLHGVAVGVVTRGRTNRDDDLTLTYLPGAIAPLTPALPLQQRPHRGGAVHAYLAGLLPDAQGVRTRWARQFEVPDHPVDLLAHMGLDCAGAVQFAPEGEEHRLAAGEASYEPVSDAEIAARLRELRRETTAASWTLPEEAWSLGGAQSKFALAYVDSKWCEATGSAPTTHIFKPGIDRMFHQAAVEFATMRATRALGLTTATVDLRVYDGEPALVVERFDRVPQTRRGSAPSQWTRIHQADMCQALGVLPNLKYERDGGPSAATVAALLRRTSTRPEADVIRFSDALMFNFLAECPDGHGKNFALLLTRHQTRLAPLYDVATGAPYDGRDAPRASAFAVGGVRRFGEAYPKTWTQHANEMRLDPDERRSRVIELAERIPDAFRDAFHTPAIDDVERGLGATLWRRMSSGPGHIGRRCQTVLERLAAQ